MSAPMIAVTWNERTLEIPEAWMMGFVCSHMQKYPKDTYAQSVFTGIAHWIHQEQLEREHSHA